jgi:sporulation protein YlmC with PRC-barrel domain
MLKTTLWSAAAALLLFGATTLTRAADEKKADLCKTPDVLGKYVRDPDNNYLGYVEDIVVDLRDGRVIYAAMNYGDTLGFGGKLFAIPPGALKPASDYRHLVLDADKAEFEKREGFNANRWPMRADERWMTARKDRKDEPTREPARREEGAGEESGQMLRRVSSLTGLAVKNDAGEDLGKIQGFAVGTDNHRIRYAVLAHGGVAGVGTKYFAIPWETLQMKSLSLKLQDRAFLLNATKEDFAKDPGFNWNDWPAAGDRRFMKNGKKPS